MTNKLNTGKNLRHIRRKYLKLTKKELADRLGISEKTVYNWEQRKSIKIINWQALLSLIEDEPFSLGYRPQRTKEFKINLPKK